MKILYGTTNRAKFALMRSVADALKFDLIGLGEMRNVPHISESGKNPLDNARIKARAYYRAFGMPVFSCDSGLYFDGLPDALQPMTHIRRVGDRELTDDQMTEYYAGLSAAHGGKLVGRYKNAIYFIYDESNVFSSMDDSLSSAPFILTSVPHAKKVSGFPLDRLSVDIATGKYYYDLERNAVDELAVVKGLTAFFADALARMNRQS